MINLKDICIEQGDFKLEGLNLKLEKGQYTVLMGRTGSGKTTLIEAICGLRKVKFGKIEFNGREVTHLKPALRGIGYVPQDGALFSTMNVHDNISFALKLRGVSKREITTKVSVLSKQLLIHHLLERSVLGLSGGERQRVSLGRALAFNPEILLLDEPLSALDETTRQDLCSLLKSLNRKLNISVLHVTHNIHEAESLADNVYKIEAGNLYHLNKNEIK